MGRMIGRCGWPLGIFNLCLGIIAFNEEANGTRIVAADAADGEDDQTRCAEALPSDTMLFLAAEEGTPGLENIDEQVT